LPTKFKPTQKRGAALAREILTLIEAEQDVLYSENHAPKNQWRQVSWALLNAEALPAGTKVEVVDPRLLRRTRSWYEGEHALVFSQGLTCGSAMCFAGHATHLAGDRMITRADPNWTDAIGAGKTSNWKRALKKASKFFLRGDAPLQFAADFVLTDGGRVQGIGDRARQLLGLTKRESSAFFEANNSLTTLRLYVERMERGQNIITGQKRSVRRPVS